MHSMLCDEKYMFAHWLQPTDAKDSRTRQVCTYIACIYAYIYIYIYVGFL